MPESVEKNERPPAPHALAEMSAESIWLVTLMTRLLLGWQPCAIARRAEAEILRLFRRGAALPATNVDAPPGEATP